MMGHFRTHAREMAQGQLSPKTELMPWGTHSLPAPGNQLKGEDLVSKAFIYKMLHNVTMLIIGVIII